MKEHPILFSTLMVQALLAGRKTQTRRTTKLDYMNAPGSNIDFVHCMEASEMTYTPRPKPGYAAFFGSSARDSWYAPIYSPYGGPGDILYVRERHCFVDDGITEFGEDAAPGYLYYASYPEDPNADRNYKDYDFAKRDELKWTPSIHMPKCAARIWLQVEGIRVERLQDISEEDAIAEGVQENTCDDPSKCPSILKGDSCCGKGQYFRYPVDYDEEPCNSAYESFMTLWQSINGRESWDANPWVWVVTFKILSTTGKPLEIEKQLFNQGMATVEQMTASMNC